MKWKHVDSVTLSVVSHSELCRLGCIKCSVFFTDVLIDQPQSVSPVLQIIGIDQLIISVVFIILETWDQTSIQDSILVLNVLFLCYIPVHYYLQYRVQYKLWILLSTNVRKSSDRYLLIIRLWNQPVCYRFTCSPIDGYDIVTVWEFNRFTELQSWK